MANLLLVDDDPEITAVVGEFLEQHGYAVERASNGAEALEAVAQRPPDLIVLDMRMPGMDGLAVCRALRPSFRGRILMLTALVDEIDEVVGLETGADDYLRKPARPRVLLARIRALLRRDGPPSPLVIDSGTRAAHVRGRRVGLTGAEFALLAVLHDHPGEIVSRDALFLALRGMEWDGVDRSIDLRVSRVRTKIVAAGGDPEWVRSVRGEGYVLLKDLA